MVVALALVVVVVVVVLMLAPEVVVVVVAWVQQHRVLREPSVVRQHLVVGLSDRVLPVPKLMRAVKQNPCQSVLQIQALACQAALALRMEDAWLVALDQSWLLPLVETQPLLA